MSLIKCPDCGRDISDQAPTCPSCGRPMIATPDKRRAVVQTEQTSKKYKLASLIGRIFWLGGGVGIIVTCFMDGEISGSIDWAIFMVIIGTVLAAYGRIGSWWHHN